MERTIKKKLRLQTLGCRLNQYETEKMAAELYPFGFERISGKGTADLTIINTCTVTHRADSDCRSMIRRAARENPNGRIVVVGCYVDADVDRVIGMDGVDVIVRNSEKRDIGTILPKQLPDLFKSEPDKSCSTILEDFHDRNRAWLKVSDGCNQACSFCLITKVRGALNNRPVKEIIDEVNSLVKFGYKEIVLTGVNMGYYRDKDSQIKNLAHLCQTIINNTDLYRMRLSSTEPQSLNDDLVAIFAGSNGRICRHFHIPMQSGSSKILREMRRPYTQKMYLEKVQLIKEAVPNTIIGADIIVGFPGETEADFERSCRVAESGLIDYLHVFSYSDREGTHATSIPDKIDPREVRKRSAHLTRISNQIRTASLKRQIGEELEVISEQKKQSDATHFGVSDNYLKVRLPQETEAGRNIVKVRINAAHNDYLEGDVVSK